MSQEFLYVEESPWPARMLRGIYMIWLLLLILLLYPYTGDPAGPIKYLATHWVVVVLGAVALGGAMAGNAPLRARSGGMALLLAFLCWNVVCALVSPHPVNALVTVSNLVAMTMIALFAAHAHRTPAQAWRVLGVAVLAVALSSVYGFCQRYGYDPFPWAGRHVEEYYGLPSTYANPNFAGHCLILAMLLALGRATRRDWFCVAFLGLAALTGAHLYLTHMRGGPLGIAAAVTFLVLYTAVRRVFPSPMRALKVTGAMALIAGIAAAGGVTGWLALHQEGPLPLDSSLILRLNGYYGACRMIADRPVTGVGPGVYDLENIPYWTSFEKAWFATENKKNGHVHCDALENGVDLGVPGMALYLGLLLWGVVSAIALTGKESPPERRRLGYTLAACFVAFGVDGLFGFNMHVAASQGLFFFLFGIVESQHDPKPLPWRTNTPVLLGMTVLAIGLATLETRNFAAEKALQRSKGAREYAARYKESGEYERRKEMLESGREEAYRAAQLAAWEPRHHEFLGLICMQLAYLDEAETAMAAALERNPNHPGMLVCLAQIHLNQALNAFNSKEESDAAAFQRELDASKECAHEALALCDVLSSAHEALGRCAYLEAMAHEKAKEDGTAWWREAADRFKQTLLLGASDAGTLERMRAQACLRIGDADGAQAALEHAAVLRVNDDEVWKLFTELAETYGRAEAFAEASNLALCMLSKQNPVDEIALRRIAIERAGIEADAGDPALARHVLAVAIATKPDDFLLWGELAGMFRNASGEYDWEAFGKEVRAAGKRLASKNNEIPLLVAAAVENGATPEAWETASELLAQSARKWREEVATDTIVSGLLWLTICLEERAGAAAWPPEMRAAFQANLGEAYAAAGEWDDADRLFAAAAPALPPARQAAAAMHRSEALAMLGRAKEALALAREAVRLTPGALMIRWNLARRLKDAGQIDQARIEYDGLLAALNASSPERKQVKEERDKLKSSYNPFQTPARKEAADDAQHPEHP